MNAKLINLFENIRRKEISDYSSCVDDECRRKINKWKEKYFSNSTVELDSIFEFMYELYIHENIDLYSYEDYISYVSSLARTYHFDISNFLAIFSEFREMIYGDN